MSEQQIVTDIDETDLEAEKAFQNGETIDEPIEEPIDEPLDSTPEEAKIHNLLRGFGWKPKEEWKGPTDNYFEADEFIEKAIRPKLDKLTQLESELQSVRQAAIRAALQGETLSKRFEEQDAASLDELKARRKKAFDLGDEKAFQDADAKLEKYYERRAKPAEAEPQNDEVKVNRLRSQPEFTSWQTENADWFGVNQEAMNYASNYSNALVQQQGITDLEALPPFARAAFYREVERAVRQQFGLTREQAKNFVPGAPASTESQPGRSQSRPGNKRGWNTLDNDARAAFITLARQGVYENTDKGKLEYAKDYYRENPNG